METPSVNDEVTRIITTMTIEQLQQHTQQLNSEQVNLNKELQAMISTNIERFHTLQQPVAQIPEKVQSFTDQIQQSQHTYNQLHQQLNSVCDGLSAFKQQAKQALILKQQMQPYEQYRSLCDDLRKHKGNLDEQLKIFSRVSKTYDYIATNGLNDSLRLYQKQNNEQIFEVIIDMVGLYSKNDFQEQYFMSLIDIGVGYDNILKITANLVSQAVPQLDLRRAIALFNNLYGQFRTNRVFFNKKTNNAIVQLLNKELQPLKDEMASYVALLTQLFSMSTETTVQQPRFKNITCLLKDQIRRYVDQCASDDDVETQSAEIRQLLGTKSTQFCIHLLERDVNGLVAQIVDDLRQTLPFDARLSNLYNELRFSQTDISCFQQYRYTLNGQIEELEARFRGQVELDTKYIGERLQEMLVRELCEQIQHHTSCKTIFVELYAVLVCQRITECGWQARITAIVEKAFASGGVQCDAACVSSVRQFFELCERLAYNITVIVGVLGGHPPVGALREVIARQMRIYLQQEGEEGIGSFVAGNSHRRDTGVVRRYVQGMDYSESMQFNLEQFYTRDVEALSSLRRPIYYALNQITARTLNSQLEFFRQTLTYDETIRILLAFLVLIITMSSIINETESDALSEVIRRLAEAARMDPVALDDLAERYDEIYRA